jgi:hypothetical protein
MMAFGNVVPSNLIWFKQFDDIVKINHHGKVRNYINLSCVSNLKSQLSINFHALTWQTSKKASWEIDAKSVKTIILNTRVLQNIHWIEQTMSHLFNLI